MLVDKNVFLTKYASHLNENQLKAVQSIDGPTLLLAVPGSGKTTVLVNRLGYMVFCKGINPSNILTLTYTVAATNDMARRFVSIFGEEYDGLLEFRTINGICYKIIQRYSQMIGRQAFDLVADEKVLGKILTDILVKNLSEYPTESDVKGAKTLITYCKNMLLKEDEIEELGDQAGIPLLDIYKEYNAYLKANRLMDYDDQMIYAYNLLKVSPELLQYYKDTYKYICVDEAQDTSKVQHVIIKLLAGENGNLFMVGDEDQSIYGFRAAYPEALLNFEKDHPAAKVLVMDQNYRSNAKIVVAADRFIQHNKDRHEKHMVSTRSAESDIHYIDLKTRSNQYNYVVKVASGCQRETAVLYRDNENALPVIDQLDRQKIPYRIKSVDMAFFTHRIVTDVTNIMRFALDPYNTDLFMRIYFKCQTFLKKNQAEQLCRISTERNIPVLEAVGYASSINGMVTGKCKALATHLRGMLKETPSKALFRIETPLGYGDYLERNNIDANKLYILKQLAGNEFSIASFLTRLEYLQNMLKSPKRNQDCQFILSTIHSSKGLEYDQVYLMDVCDGVFPSNVVTSSHATMQELKAFEEERRLFYVGMTRAKNDLHIFKVSSETSSFIDEITATVYSKESKKVVKANTTVRTKAPFFKSQKTILKSDFDLIIGERVVQIKYGPGSVNDVEYGSEGYIEKFTVEFDSGEEKTFSFPIAFKMGMALESGEKVNISEEILVAKSEIHPPKVVKNNNSLTSKKAGNNNSYAYWALAYPDHVVVKKEGAFWTCRGESAETVSDLLGYRLGGSTDKPVTGSPNLEPITEGLRANAISYIIVEDGMIVEQREF